MTKELGAEFIGTFMLVSSVCRSGAYLPPRVWASSPSRCRSAPAVLAMAYAVGPDFRRSLQSGRNLRAGGGRSLRSAARRSPTSSPRWSAERRRRWSSTSSCRARRHRANGIRSWRASNTYGGAGFPLLSVALIERGLTALFLVVITGVTSSKAAGRLRADRHRADAGDDPSASSIPVFERLGQSGALDRNRDFRRRRGDAVAMAVLGRAYCRRHHRRPDRQGVL